MPSLEILLNLLIAVIIGYLLGAIPVAALVSRYRGVDIFSTGTGLAGAGNVFHNVGRKEGFAVFAGDFAKGGLAIIIAYRLGLVDLMALSAATAVVLGHWHSPFTGFRGGDGLSSLGGAALVLLPVTALLSFAFATIVFVVARRTDYHPTLWSSAAGYGFLFWRASTSDANLGVALGVAALSLLVIGHAVLGHRRQGASSLPQ
jgi:acyl-phosphate glycerol 3-phosphate acyltransferase